MSTITIKWAETGCFVGLSHWAGIARRHQFPDTAAIYSRLRMSSSVLWGACGKQRYAVPKSQLEKLFSIPMKEGGSVDRFAGKPLGLICSSPEAKYDGYHKEAHLSNPIFPLLTSGCWRTFRIIKFSLDLFRSGGSPHGETKSRLERRGVNTTWTQAKKVNLAICYGGTAWSLKDNLGLDNAFKRESLPVDILLLLHCGI